MERINAASIGRRVAAYRRDIGFTAEELARELGPDVTGNAITKLERGHRAQIGPDLLVDIARALGVSPLALLFPIDDPDAEVVVGGIKAPVRSIGAWLLGQDPTTSTFRHLVAADRAVGVAEAADRDAPDDERLNARKRLDDERWLRTLLENDLRAQRERRAARDTRAPEPTVIATLDYSKLPARSNEETDRGIDQTAP